MNSIPTQSLSRAELQALVCGSTFSSFESASPYVSTGLIHLFVVSGAHLIFLHKIIEVILKKRVSKLFYTVVLNFTLIIFAAMCEFNPPISRALVAFGLNQFLDERKIFWPLHFKILIVGLISLSLEPSWLQSVSLQLSWIIALGLNLNSGLLQKSHLITKQFILYILIFPTLIYFQVPQIYTIFINLLLAPVLEFILFPLALLVTVFHFLYSLFDSLILILKTVISFFEIKYQFQYYNKPESFLILNWFIIFIVHFLIHLTHLKYKRAQQ